MHTTPKNNLLGKRFNKLIAVKYSGKTKNNKRPKHTWLCKCDCGNEKIILEHNLKNGHTKSCGCLTKRKNNNSPLYKGYKGISGQKWSSLKIEAKKRNIEFNITIEYIWNLFLKQDKKCALSNLNIYIYSDNKIKNTASLDRIDSSKGYIEDNVQWVHKNINQMKWNFKQKYFIEMCLAVATFSMDARCNDQ